MENVGYYNGQIGLIKDIMVPMEDRACYFGDGVYDATCGRNHIPFALDEHIERFYNSAGLAKIKIPMTKGELKTLLLDLTSKIDTDGDIMVYWQISRGAAPREHVFPNVDANLWVYVKESEMPDLTQRMKLITADDTRFLHCNIKTLNLLPNVIIREKAKENGCEEAILHRNGRVTECTHSNVSILIDGVLKTAPTDNLILPGIARAHLIKACKSFNIPVDESPFSLEELFMADEIIVTNSGLLCGVASEIDGSKIGGKATDVVVKLQRALEEEFDNETKKK